MKRGLPCPFAIFKCVQPITQNTTPISAILSKAPCCVLDGLFHVGRILPRICIVIAFYIVQTYTWGLWFDHQRELEKCVQRIIITSNYVSWKPLKLCYSSWYLKQIFYEWYKIYFVWLRNVWYVFLQSNWMNRKHRLFPNSFLIRLCNVISLKLGQPLSSTV